VMIVSLTVRLRDFGLRNGRGSRVNRSAQRWRIRIVNHLAVVLGLVDALRSETVLITEFTIIICDDPMASY
jgi:hypothetical protein